ncbi:MAG: hypothetical protein JOY54_04605 [Acidobacteriaceae bacterium]|nr:hypothetical protein [Acidobacteriaceae bacterium]
MNSHNQDELIGRIYRHKAAHRQRLSFIDAELSNAASLLKKASSQMEALLAREPSKIDSVLSRIDIDEILKLLAERAQLQRRIADANEQLQKLGVRP